MNLNHGTTAPIYYREDDGRRTESARTASEAQGMASSAAIDLPASVRLGLRKQLFRPGEGGGLLGIARLFPGTHHSDGNPGAGECALCIQDAFEPDLRGGAPGDRRDCALQLHRTRATAYLAAGRRYAACLVGGLRCDGEPDAGVPRRL